MFNTIHIKNGILDLSTQDIVYDALGKAVIEGGERLGRDPILITDVTNFLKRRKGEFTKLNLADNLIGDEGLEVLVEELINHENLEELNISSNKITDGSMELLIPILKMSNFTKLIIEDNYGPCDDTLSLLDEAIQSCDKPKCEIIV